VIEIGQLLAGPFVGTRLADFGADELETWLARLGYAV
jgi:hypothetical protein